MVSRFVGDGQSSCSFAVAHTRTFETSYLVARRSMLATVSYVGSSFSQKSPLSDADHDEFFFLSGRVDRKSNVDTHWELSKHWSSRIQSCGSSVKWTTVQSSNDSSGLGCAKVNISRKTSEQNNVSHLSLKTWSFTIRRRLPSSCQNGLYEGQMRPRYGERRRMLREEGMSFKCVQVK